MYLSRKWLISIVANRGNLKFNKRHIQESIKYGWKVKGYRWKLLNQDNPVPSTER